MCVCVCVTGNNVDISSCVLSSAPKQSSTDKSFMALSLGHSLYISLDLCLDQKYQSSNSDIESTWKRDIVFQ